MVPRDRLSAIHVHHGLHPDADQWQIHCQELCDQWRVPLVSRRVQVNTDNGLEAGARAARYAVFEDLVGAGEALLLAHHADDQAETLLLNALRGAGVRGLAGIPARRALGRGSLIRPLLQFPRRVLRDWLVNAGVDWIDDPSNLDTSIPRNFLRREVLPLLESRWPSARERLAQAADHCRDTAAYLGQRGQQLLDQFADLAGNALHLEDFTRLSPVEKHEVLNAWLLQRGLPLPGEAVERQIIAQLSARTDAQPLVEWKGAELRRYRNYAYVYAPQQFPEACWETQWTGAPLAIPHCGRLLCHGNASPGMLTVRFYKGGETLKLRADGPTKTVKKLFQEHGVPPWERRRLPFLYQQEKLVAVADFWFEHGFADDLRERDLSVQFVPLA